MPLIIVESPAKARTISRYLGSEYTVESSIGHIRDLPANPDEIPASLRGKPWARTGVDIENNFEPLWVIPANKLKQVKKLKSLLKKASVLYLATDEDREGEAIAWHLQEVLAPKVPVQRMVFHEITPKAITEALANPRQVNRQLVNAQEARRILDRLYGYELSPVLWRKVRPRLSAGRVQSVATRMVVERERARMVFVAASYWSLTASLSVPEQGSAFDAELQQVGGRRIATGRHFDSQTGTLSADAKSDNVLLLDEQRANALKAGIEDKPLAVTEIERKPFTQRPYPPFITSTLQQEASRKLRFTAQRTMRVAQHLYERGYITYMRTDSTTLSQQAIAAARRLVKDRFGADYLPAKPRLYTRKAKGAQEAHEAIRPAGEDFRDPESLRKELSREALDLYTLIWKRTVASQMKDASGERTRVWIGCDIDGALCDAQGVQQALFVASGKTITFPGYLRAYVEGADDPEAELEDREKLLPAMTEGQQLRADKIEARGHTTQPPARFTEASLVKELEERGIGRPSTYANIIQTIQDRGYTFKQGSALVPTLTAFAVIKLLEEYFWELVDYDFTARMESDLDAIGNGEKELQPWLEAFYFGEGGRDGNSNNGSIEALPHTGLQRKIAGSVDKIDARRICTLELGETSDGEPIVARVGRYGPYLQVDETERRAPIPDGVLPDQLTPDEALRLLKERDRGNRELGVDSDTGKMVMVKTGAYGPYVQLGDPELTPKGNIKKGGKPKMASLWPGMSPETIDLDTALMLLSFPKVLGTHPENGADITVQDGKFGPYLQMVTPSRKESRSLTHEQLATIDLEEALKLLAQPRPGRQVARGVLATLGASEVTGSPIEVRSGRYGPYVTDGQVNAKIPRGREPNTITLDDAVELIAQREQLMRDQGKDPRAKKVRGAKSAPKKKAAKKTAKKAAKKTTKKTAKKAPAKKKSAAKKKPATKKTTTRSA